MVKAGIFGATLVLSAASVQAASLSVIGGDAGVLAGNFSIADIAVGSGDAVTIFEGESKSPAEGLTVDMMVNATFTLVGFEAAFMNEFALGGSTLTNTSDPIGSSFTAAVGPGLIDFSLSTLNFGGRTFNAGSGAGGHDFAISLLSPTSAYILYDDPTTDIDFDDLGILVELDVAPIPLPASMWMFGAAMSGLMLMSRRRSAT